MAMHKAIKSGKEHRKEYYGCKAIDPSCRNHGNCPWCTGNRTFKNKTKDKIAKKEIRDFYK